MLSQGRVHFLVELNVSVEVVRERVELARKPFAQLTHQLLEHGRNKIFTASGGGYSYRVRFTRLDDSKSGFDELTDRLWYSSRFQRLCNPVSRLHGC